MDVPTWVWIATFVVTVAIFAFDLVIVGRRPHQPSMKECATYLSIYVGMAIVFGFGVWFTSGGTPALEFFSGWLVEYSLSIDNLFIFIIIMSKFAVPKELQQYALMIGIVMALVMRAIFIAVGAAAINNFSWVFYLFGLFLIYTAFKLAKEGSEDEDEFEENKLVAFIEKRFPATSEWHGKKLLVSGDNAKKMITPMFIVILTLGTTDLLFALDSIPAIFGITKEPYLVLTANIFALMGLRQLYFLIGGLLQRLVYLSYGLAFLLAFIGCKLIVHAMHTNELGFINGGEHITLIPEVPIWLSLVVIVATLALTAVLSLWASRRMTTAEQDAATGPRREWDDD